MRRYPGITPFKPEDAPVFKGRATETKEVSNLVLTQKTMILFSKSGMGKTSLLNAGVVPNLRRYGLFPIFIRFNEVGSGDNQTPIQRFLDQYRMAYEAFTASRARAKEYGTQSTLWETLCNNQFISRGNALIPILIFDQFEEFFRTFPQRSMRVEFLQQLAQLLSDTIPHGNPLPSQQAEAGGEVKPLNLRVVFSLRSDMLNLMQEVSEYLPFVMRTRYELRPLDRQQATQAICEPGLVADGPYETGPILFPNDVLTDILTGLQDAYSGEIESFQLQLVCSYLEDKFVNSPAGPQPSVTRTVQKEDYGGVTGIQNINEVYFTNVIDAITGQSGQSRETVMNEIITLLNENGNRILREDSELALPPTVKEALVDKRIFKRDKIQGNTYYEISHDKIALAVGKERERVEEEERAKEQNRKRVKTIRTLTNIVLIFLFALGLLFYYNNKISKQNKDLESTQATLDSTITELNSITDTLKSTNSKLNSKNVTLDSTITILDSTTSALVSTNSNLNKAIKEKAKSDIANADLLMSSQLYDKAFLQYEALKRNAKTIKNKQLKKEILRKLSNSFYFKSYKKYLVEIQEYFECANSFQAEFKFTCANRIYNKAKKSQNDLSTRIKSNDLKNKLIKILFDEETLNSRIGQTDSTTVEALKVYFGIERDKDKNKGKPIYATIYNSLSQTACSCSKTTKP